MSYPAGVTTDLIEHYFGSGCSGPKLTSYPQGRVPSTRFADGCSACGTGFGPLCPTCAAQVEQDLTEIDRQRARAILSITEGL